MIADSVLEAVLAFFVSWVVEPVVLAVEAAWRAAAFLAALPRRVGFWLGRRL